jgi:hypothetical protein
MPVTLERKEIHRAKKMKSVKLSAGQTNPLKNKKVPGVVQSS